MSPFDRCFAHLTSADAPADAVAVRSLLADALGDRFVVEHAATSTSTLTLLDSADERLRSAGIDLVAVDRDRLEATRSDSTVTGPPPVRWPALITDLPDGPVRNLLVKPLGVRALVPLASVRAHALRFDVRNDDDKIVTRICWWHGELLRRHLVTDAAALPVLVQVLALRGYQGMARRVAESLAAIEGFSTCSTSWADAVRTVVGPIGRPARRAVMTPDQPADAAVADALLGFLDDIDANVAGTITGIDTEHLHDLRVAVRRSRSVLKLLGDTLPTDVAEVGTREFARLGRLTTPTRDLDVYLLAMDSLAQRVARPDDLSAFRDHVAQARATAQRALVRELRSAQFTAFVTGWRQTLRTVRDNPSPSAPSAAQLEADRVQRMFRRTVKRAAALTVDSPGEQVHELRKRGKELRYLLEVFQPVSAPKAYAKVLADIKRLQDVLGRFQDAEVQATTLREFADTMVAAEKPSAGAILAMGELAAGFDADQRVARADLDAHQGRYLGKRTARNVDRLISSR